LQPTYTLEEPEDEALPPRMPTKDSPANHQSTTSKRGRDDKEQYDDTKIRRANKRGGEGGGEVAYDGLGHDTLDLGGGRHGCCRAAAAAGGASPPPRNPTNARD